MDISCRQIPVYNIANVVVFGHNKLWWPLTANSLSVTSQKLCPLATPNCVGHWLQITSLWPLKYVLWPQQSLVDRPVLYKTKCVMKIFLQFILIKLTLMAGGTILCYLYRCHNIWDETERLYILGLEATSVHSGRKTTVIINN